MSHMFLNILIELHQVLLYFHCFIHLFHILQSLFFLKKFFLFLNEFLQVCWSTTFLSSAVRRTNILIRDLIKFARINQEFECYKRIWLSFIRKSLLLTFYHRSCLNHIIPCLSFKTLMLLTTRTNFFLHLMCQLIQLINQISMFEIINTYKILLDLVQRPIPQLIPDFSTLNTALAPWFFLLSIIQPYLFISLT